MNPLLKTLQHGLAIAFLLLLSWVSIHGDEYDPLAVDADFTPRLMDVSVDDQQRQRHIPIRIYLPEDEQAAPVVLFSHGLGGTRESNAYLGRHWAARGYVAVFLQHPGSDAAVWQDVPPARRMRAMRAAASPQNFLLRAQDVPAVLDQIAAWNESEDHALAGRLDMKQIGMSGYSFGAITTQAVSGQSFGQRQAMFTDPRINASVMMSPSSPTQGSAQAAFAEISLPWMLMTGTHDVALIGGADMQSRLAVYPALPPGGKYEVVLFEAEHSAFADHALPSDRKPRNPNHHRAVRALSTAFWDSYLRQDPAAQQWLDGDGAKSVLEEQDRWQRK